MVFSFSSYGDNHGIMLFIYSLHEKTLTDKVAYVVHNTVSFLTNVCSFFQVPQLFLDGKYIGGEKEITLLHHSGKLGSMLVTSGALKRLND